ncbi:DMT family transporter [Roseisalinus antarcticus]|uniref:EamA-like transporter family protein n=1 Tax=Roseisalinus antarcticus TaxID=254357 RepID=A0A1Y5TZ92_9RHOB|nr:DMT family transporter [Roseisalinus antarcticus]SLN77406.1 EamA-like transporter family protein [Roseisalinus antarcticus]
MALSDNMRGAVLMMVAMTAFTVNDVLLKGLSGDLPIMQVIFLRGVLTSVLLGVAAWRMGVLKLAIPRRDRGLIALRCLGEAGAAWFFLSALYHMPIANLSAILQALPLVVTLGCAVVFGDPVGWRRLTAILAGFVGVLLIVRPGAEDFSLYSMYGVATVLCSAVRDMATRRLSQAVPSLTVTFFTSVAVMLMGLVLGLTQDWGTPTTNEMLTIVAAGCLVIGAYLSVIMSMRVGDIAFVAPFRYAGLVVAIILGLLVFGDFPDPLTWIGSGIVVASGLFSFWRERRLAIPRKPVPPR